MERLWSPSWLTVAGAAQSLLCRLSVLANSRIETGFLLLSFLSREKEFLEYISKHECLKFWTIIFSRIEELDKKKKSRFHSFHINTCKGKKETANF